MTNVSDIRVCQLLHHLTLGGVQRQLLSQLEAASSAVEHVVCHLGEDERLRDEFEQVATEVVRLVDGPADPRYQFDPRRLRAVVSFLRDRDVDVLHCHSSLYVLVVGRLCGRLAGVPVVGSYHNVRDGFHPTTRVAERLTRRASHANVAVSETVERSFAGDAHRYRPGEPLDRRTVTVYNGIDAEAFGRRVAATDASSVRTRLDIGPDQSVLLCVGRYSPEKRQETLIEALTELPNWHLVLVGWGPLESHLRRHARRAGVSDRVSVTGRVPSVHEYYATADLFALASETEGLPVTVLEAMAAGLPVIGTAVPGTTEAVRDGETGIVVPPGDPEELAGAVARLTPATRKRFGTRARERSRTVFDIGTTVAAYESIYRAAAGRPLEPAILREPGE